MEWNNFYVIIIIALIFGLVLVLMYILPKLLPIIDESTTTIIANSALATTTPSSSTTVMMPLLLEHHSKKELKRVEVWQKKYPPNITHDYTLPTDSIWKFEPPDQYQQQQHQATANVQNNTLLIFHDNAPACSFMSNFPLPPTKPFIYFEATILELTHMVALGLSTKPYPSWRLPGWHLHSVAYHSSNGCIYTSSPKYPSAYGPRFDKNDVIGVGYLSQSNTMFFTKNGRSLGKAITGFKFPLYPSIGAIGKTKIMVNFGQQAFCYDSANIWQAGLVNNQDLPLPPPVYGSHLRDTLLFDQRSSPHVAVSVSSPNGDDGHTSSMVRAPTTAGSVSTPASSPSSSPPNYPL